MEHRTASAAVTNTPTRPHRRSAGPRSSTDAAFVLDQSIKLLLGSWSGELQTERDLVEYALAFVNGETDRAALLHALESGDVHNAATPQERRSILEWLMTSDDFGPGEPWTLKGAALERFLADTLNTTRIRRLLIQLVRGKKYAEALFSGRADELLGGIHALPRVGQNARGLRLQWQTMISGIAGFEAYLSLLLLDDERHLGDAVCRCRYEGCGKYFLAKSAQAGRTRRNYCSQEHTELAHNESAAKRMAKLRQKRKITKVRKAK